jgi:PPOX class probable F420-dependent enzyme
MTALETVQAQQRFSAARVAVLGTVSRSGDPHLVPVTFALAAGAVVFAIDHKPKTTTELRRLQNIEGNPRVSFLAHEYDDEWSRLWWVRVDATAEILTAGEQYQNALDTLLRKYSQYRSVPPTGVVVSARIAKLVGWTAAP